MRQHLGRELYTSVAGPRLELRFVSAVSLKSSVVSNVQKKVILNVNNFLSIKVHLDAMILPGYCSYLLSFLL